MDRRKRRNAGFTMAELLIVVGIVVALSAVAFVVIISHMRNMAKLQRDAYAKEIFVAAQNHLAMAKSQGYLGEVNNCGTAETARDSEGGKDGVYLYEVESGVAKVGDSASTGILNLMLPFGSIDDTLLGGSYIIRYHKEAGEILDVFYWEEQGRYSLEYQDSDYPVFLTNKEDVEYMKNYRGGSVVGWFGGEDAERLPHEKMKKPRISVRNAERLVVTVSDTNMGKGILKLLITGNTSGACKEIVVREPKEAADLTLQKYKVVLDDITTPVEHFYFQFCKEAQRGKDFPVLTSDEESVPKDHWFIPGEDISIQALAYNKDSLANVAYGSKWTTNSLFASIKASGSDSNKKYTASVTNIRHLENLDKLVSNLDYLDSKKADVTAAELVFKYAKQQGDLKWEEFITKINEGKAADEEKTVYIYPYEQPDETESKLTPANCFYPVTLDNISEYDGTNHSVFGVKVDHTDVVAPGTDRSKDAIGAGLFGTLRGAAGTEGTGSEPKKVSNLKLVDFTVKGSESAGALAGVVDTAEIENVVAFTSDGGFTLRAGEDAFDKVVTGTTAGGLIGSVKNSTLSQSAAAMMVHANETAGGLVGRIGETEEEDSTFVIACYAGGHTEDADYAKLTQKDAAGEEITVGEGDERKPLIQYNVTAGSTDSFGTAGGLVGDAGTAQIYYSYSTCSVCANTFSTESQGAVGGFAGKAAGGIHNSYATGLVSDGRDNIFGTTDGTEVFGTKEGAFIGIWSGTWDGVNGAILPTVTDCNYYGIINGRRDLTGDYKYMPAIGGDYSSDDGKVLLEKLKDTIKEFDASAESYEAFVGGIDKEEKNWRTAIAYDLHLTNYYRGMYNLRTVEQLVPADDLILDDTDDSTAIDITPEDGIKVSFNDEIFVRVHFGDWPALETFVVNENQ